MIGVADRDAIVQMICPQDDGYPLSGLRGVRRLSFRDQRGIGNAAVQQVVVADSALAVTGISRSPSRSNDDGRHSAHEQIKCVVKPGAINRRRPSRVFGSSKYHDGIGRMNLFLRGGANDVVAASLILLRRTQKSAARESRLRA